MDNREAFVALNMIEGVGPVRVRQLLERFKEPGDILRASATQLQAVPGIGPEVARSIASWEANVDLSGELQRIRDFQCHILISADEDYPDSLRHIYDPPIVLYVKGKLTRQDRNAIALVGSRLTSHYGMECARRLAFQIAYAGVTVVSGGARGIDTSAHQGAMQAKGRTIAVLGTGINIVFPAENVSLFEQIISSGALMTQFPFNRKGDRQSFPIRNRIVAGMTLGTVVVEATLTSGAMITANMAAEYGRQIFAVPGQIDSPRSKGCHDLIKKGAKLCEGAEDVLGEFEYLFPAAKKVECTPENPSSTSTLTLTDSEKQIYELVTEQETGIDEIIRASGSTASVVSVILFGLEMKRLVRQLPGKNYVRNR
jgi:DNA processing protein